MEEEENEEEHRELIHKFYQIYRPIQKNCGLRYHMHFDIYGNNLIEICYKRAIEILESYNRKDTVKHEKKAG